MEGKIRPPQGKVASQSLPAQSDTHLSFSVTVDGSPTEFKPNARDFQAPVLLVSAYPASPLII